MLKKWEKIPGFMQIPEVRPYWEHLSKRRGQILLKRIFDYVFALILVIILAIPMAVISIIIKFDSPGPVFFRQDRVTTYGKHFKIHKFRTMVNNAERIGSSVTSDNDSRITKVGHTLRRLRLDEFPQLFDILSGNMSFVGTRPEAAKYVEEYLPDYYATLLLPAGITSETSIAYSDEALMLANSANADTDYVAAVLPAKMRLNLKSIENFSFWGDIKTMIKTVTAVLKNKD